MKFQDFSLFLVKDKWIPREVRRQFDLMSKLQRLKDRIFFFCGMTWLEETSKNSRQCLKPSSRLYWWSHYDKLRRSPSFANDILWQSIPEKMMIESPVCQRNLRREIIRCNFMTERNTSLCIDSHSLFLPRKDDYNVGIFSKLKSA